MSLTLRIVRPSSRESTDLLPPRLAELRQAGMTVLYEDLPGNPEWTYSAGTAVDRARALAGALTERGTDAVLCARGGYGASDLLPLLDWQALARAKPKLLVGFSDISALHSALYTRLGWHGVHGPMPATVLWRQDGRGDDVDAMLQALHGIAAGRGADGSLPLAGAEGARLSGRLYGGNFTVLTSLIGTPYFPRSLANHIVFVEDLSESPARLMRSLNQWTQSGALADVNALVVGHLRQLGDNIPDCAPFVLTEFVRRAGVPVFHTPLFGHTSPNFPLAIGAEAQIADGRLTWRLAAKGRSRSEVTA